jgi:GNAT superfamily N-acetyltransferase
MNDPIEYIETDQRGLDSIGFLWEKLNEHHRVRSLYHSEHFKHMTFDIRKNGLLEKAKKATFRLDIAKDIKTGKYIGYCLSSITEDKVGEIESIFIESEYRHRKIGDYFIMKALIWMDGIGTNSRIIGVGVGNEEVFPFYAKYGFYPRVHVLQRLEIP